MASIPEISVSQPKSRGRRSLRTLLFVQLVEQGLGIIQIGGIEAFGEPVVDFGEHRARFVAMTLLREQSREAGRGAQFKTTGLLAGRSVDRRAKQSLGFVRMGRSLDLNQFASYAIEFGSIETLATIAAHCQSAVHRFQTLLDSTRLPESCGKRAVEL